MQKKSPLTRIALLTVAVAVATLSAPTSVLDIAWAQDSVFKERSDYMKGLGQSMKQFSNYVKRGRGEPLELAAMAGDISTSASEIPALFPEDTGMEQNADSEAKPIIWQEWEEFVEAANALGNYAAAAEKAFESGDDGAIADAFKNLGRKGCGGCHERFRQKKN